MKIKSLKIQNFKKIDFLDINFSEDQNIIFGLNEAGKSSIKLAIETLFYTDTSTRSQAFLQSIKSWDSEYMPIISALLLVGDKYFELIKDFENRTTKLTDVGANVTITDSKKVTEKLCNMLGISSIDVYSTIASFSAKELIAIDDKSEIRTLLQNLSTGVSANVSQILEKLDKEIKDLRLGINGFTKNKGKLRLLQENIAEKSQDFQEYVGKYDEYIKSLQVVKVGEVELKELKAKISNLERKIEDNKKLEIAETNLISVQDNIDTIYNNISEIEKLQTNDADIRRRESSLTIDVSLLDEKDQLVRELISQIDLTRDEIDQQQIKLKEIINAKNIQQGPKLSGIQNILLIFGSIFLMLSIYLIVNSNQFVGIILFALSLLSLTLGIFAKFGIWDISFASKTNDSKINLQLPREKISKLEEKLEYLNIELSKILKSLEVTNIVEFYELKTKIASLEAEKFSTESFLKKKLQANTKYAVDNLEGYIIALRREYETLLKKKSELEITQIKPFLNARLSSAEISTIQEELKQLNDKKYDLEDEIRRSEIKTEEKLSLDKRNTFEEELFELKEQYNHYQEKLNILEITRDYLGKALRNITLSSSTAVQLILNKYIREITNGNYSKIIVADDFSMHVVRGNEKVNVDKLSSGTIEQIYFLAKLAFLQLLSNDKYPPIILDDTFVNFDEVRTSRAFQIIESFSTQHQMLFFTCQERYLQDLGESWNKVEI